MFTTYPSSARTYLFISHPHPALVESLLGATSLSVHEAFSSRVLSFENH